MYLPVFILFYICCLFLLYPLFRVIDPTGQEWTRIALLTSAVIPASIFMGIAIIINNQHNNHD